MYNRVVAARQRLDEVEISDEILSYIAGLSIALGVDGHRADITMLQTAKALAAFEGETSITKDMLERAARLVLPHRMRRRPFEEQTIDWQVVEEILAEAQ